MAWNESLKYICSPPNLFLLLNWSHRLLEAENMAIYLTFMKENIASNTALTIVWSPYNKKAVTKIYNFCGVFFGFVCWWFLKIKLFDLYVLIKKTKPTLKVN